ncbi:MAG TPA: rhodanese-like domain-containing protein [Gemmatimonadaceae bacterium]|nr:rhodanese-like domain-containing protein [Gemmatimonadaceae bacterium]
MKSREQLLAEVKARIIEITPQEAVERQQGGEDAVYLDVREPGEWNLFRIPGAVLVPLGELEDSVETQVPRDKRVVVYCARGNRSAIAADVMQQMGYRDVASLAGGIGAWAYAGGAIDDS